MRKAVDPLAVQLGSCHKSAPRCMVEVGYQLHLLFGIDRAHVYTLCSGCRIRVDPDLP